jgi:glycosyltransferase involved in cell wall biosynthesis
MLYGRTTFPYAASTPMTELKIIGLMVVYNEADIVDQSIAHMTKQGIPMVVIDNGSTDGSLAIEQGFLGKGVLEVRVVPPDPYYDLKRVLNEAYALALNYSPDWLVRVDADEFIESPYPHLTLAEAIENEARLGYNMIQVNFFDFLLTERDYQGKDRDVRKRFRYYTWLTDFHYRAWRHYPGTNLVTYAGHKPAFLPDVKENVSPFKFPLRHYKFRSVEQGMRKVFKERLPRYDPKNVSLGWHVQYSAFKPDPSYFIVDSLKLNRYDEDGRWSLERVFDSLYGGWTSPNVEDHLPQARRSAMMKSANELFSYLLEKAKTKSDINEHLLFLYEMVVNSNAQNIVELGTRDGNSTCALVIGAAKSGGHVVSVDHGKGAEYAGETPTWDALTQTSASITGKLGLGDFWTIIVKDDVDFAKQYHEEVDLLFIDTEHSYEQTKRELEAWGTKVVNGGMIVIHDTVSFPEQNKAIWEFLDRYPGSNLVEHKNCNGLCIIIKNATGLTKDNIPRNKQELAFGLWRERADRMQEALIEMRNRLRVKDDDFNSIQRERSALGTEINQLNIKIRAVETDLSTVRKELAKQESETNSLKAETISLKTETEALKIERASLVEQLSSTQKELEAVHHSLGYKLMKFYAKRLDRLFPDKTSRGAFRERVTAGLGALTEKGNNDNH